MEIPGIPDMIHLLYVNNNLKLNLLTLILAGSFQEAGVIDAAYRLNNPIKVSPNLSLPNSVPDQHSYIQVDNQAVIVEAVKKVRGK